MIEKNGVGPLAEYNVKNIVNALGFAGHNRNVFVLDTCRELFLMYSSYKHAGYETGVLDVPEHRQRVEYVTLPERSLWIGRIEDVAFKWGDNYFGVAWPPNMIFGYVIGEKRGGIDVFLARPNVPYMGCTFEGKA